MQSGSVKHVTALREMLHKRRKTDTAGTSKAGKLTSC